MFFDRPAAGSRSLLVHIVQPHSELSSSDELNELVRSAGLKPVGCVTSSRKFPHPATHVGQGKVEEISEQAATLCAELIIFDADLSPSQERNLEVAFNTRVLGRTGLILEIFALRARTHEGKLQVELAQLGHAATRLVRGWTHLDRQRGGSGRSQGATAGLGGAGETQLESDQRMLADRTRRIHQRLEKVRRQRHQNRKSRRRSDTRTVSLAGYTNAGKSTLFNRLCESRVWAADQLFATLDPTLRQLSVPGIGQVVLSDTVGFIRALPHSLVDAFHATLEEVAAADLILHVIDVSAPGRDERIEQVNKVLTEIGAELVPQLAVYNKIDACRAAPHMDRDESGRPCRVWVSAATGEGLDLLVTAIGELLADDMVETCITLLPHEGDIRAKLFELGAVLSESTDDQGRIQMDVRIEQKELGRLR
ncbi:MAG: GTPase HflX [Proteobacteria bacterium]|nr:GTPase HflX [Pseudomonadota bacterium]MDA1301300.1 GTPase HflX [Pseudomonadota bacterium]